MSKNLTTRLLTASIAALMSAAAHSGDLNGPLFGLDRAPNGDILVSDTSQGIVSLNDPGRTIAAPLITDTSAIGRSAMWVSRTGMDQHADSGQALLRVSQGSLHQIANLFAFEAQNNPDGGVVESNPFDVQKLSGDAALVVDSAGNDLLRIDNDGNINVLAVFPKVLASTDNIKALFGGGCPDNPANPFCGLPPALPADAVPTGLAIGADGYYYVGELVGFPAPSDQSRIWRVSPDAIGDTCPNPYCDLVFDGGFTSIIDMAFGADGLLYVAELDAQSWFAVEAFGSGAGGRIKACDVHTATCQIVSAGIPQLTAIVFGDDGLYATENALIPGQATVVRVQ